MNVLEANGTCVGGLEGLVRGLIDSRSFLDSDKDEGLTVLQRALKGWVCKSGKGKISMCMPTDMTIKLVKAGVMPEDDKNWSTNETEVVAYKDRPQLADEVGRIVAETGPYNGPGGRVCVIWGPAMEGFGETGLIRLVSWWTHTLRACLGKEDETEGDVEIVFILENVNREEDGVDVKVKKMEEMAANKAAPNQKVTIRTEGEGMGWVKKCHGKDQNGEEDGMENHSECRKMFGLTTDGKDATSKAVVCFTRFMLARLTNPTGAEPVKMCKECGGDCVEEECKAQGHLAKGRTAEGAEEVGAEVEQPPAQRAEEEGPKEYGKLEICGYCGAHRGKCGKKGKPQFLDQSCNYLECTIDKKKVPHLSSLHEQVFHSYRYDLEKLYEAYGVFHAKAPRSYAHGSWGKSGGRGGRDDGYGRGRGRGGFGRYNQ
jgi:hypothetical protein